MFERISFLNLNKLVFPGTAYTSASWSQPSGFSPRLERRASPTRLNIASCSPRPCRYTFTLNPYTLGLLLSPGCNSSSHGAGRGSSERVFSEDSRTGLNPANGVINNYVDSHRRPACPASWFLQSSELFLPPPLTLIVNQSPSPKLVASNYHRASN